VSASDYATLATLGAIAFAGSFIFGVTGFGSALLTIPLATHLVPLPFALAMFALLDCVSAWRIGLSDPKNAVGAEWTRMLPFIVIGTVVGMTILVNLPRSISMAALGAFVLSVAVSNLVRAGSLSIASRKWAYGAGFAGGTTSTLFGAGGPPYAIYLSRRPLTKEQYRATLGICTMFSISLRVVAFVLAGPLQSPKPWLWALAVLPASLGGLWLASKAFSRFSRDHLIRAIGIMLAASGISLIGRALTAA
jgi:uncharacterized membrane protein YfcA